jgi:hypothetical protein
MLQIRQRPNSHNDPVFNRSRKSVKNISGAAGERGRTFNKANH